MTIHNFLDEFLFIANEFEKENLKGGAERWWTAKDIYLEILEKIGYINEVFVQNCIKKYVDIKYLESHPLLKEYRIIKLPFIIEFELYYDNEIKINEA